MTRAILALSLACAVLAGWQTYRLREALARADAAEAQVSAYQEAARIRAKTDAAIAAQAAEAAALDHDLASQEGANGPLSDYLRSAAGSLWP